VIAWDSEQPPPNSPDVFAQRFFASGVRGAVDPLTDGLLFLRYLFGFRGGILTAGAVAGNCTRCTAAQIEAFIDGLLPAEAGAACSRAHRDSVTAPTTRRGRARRRRW
jgi:hypothetical protein